jgi:hypothetical protein
VLIPEPLDFVFVLHRHIQEFTEFVGSQTVRVGDFGHWLQPELGYRTAASDVNVKRLAWDLRWSRRRTGILCI